jgi:ATP-dependent Clp protease adaptor protein ClpS
MTRKPAIEHSASAKKKEFKNNDLVLHNDDVNTFDYVIESLIDICNHDREQAEQCSIIVHNNGKCGVKKGTVKYLKPMCQALIERGLTASIE